MEKTIKLGAYGTHGPGSTPGHLEKNRKPLMHAPHSVYTRRSEVINFLELFCL